MSTKTRGGPIDANNECWTHAEKYVIANMMDIQSALGRDIGSDAKAVAATLAAAGIYGDLAAIVLGYRHVDVALTRHATGTITKQCGGCAVGEPETRRVFHHQCAKSAKRMMLWAIYNYNSPGEYGDIGRLALMRGDLCHINFIAEQYCGPRDYDIMNCGAFREWIQRGWLDQCEAMMCERATWFSGRVVVTILSDIIVLPHMATRLRLFAAARRNPRAVDSIAVGRAIHEFVRRIRRFDDRWIDCRGVVDFLVTFADVAPAMVVSAIHCGTIAAEFRQRDNSWCRAAIVRRLRDSALEDLRPKYMPRNSFNCNMCGAVVKEF